MTLEGKITWELLRNIADTFDSYRIRALIDAKEDILNAGIYDEKAYYEILFKMFDEEQLKYSLLRYLKIHEPINLSGLKIFSENHSLEFKKTFSLVQMLQGEQLIQVSEFYEEIPSSTEEQPPKKLFKDISITCFKGDFTKIKSVYEPVKTIFSSENCSGCGVCSGICPVNCITLKNGKGSVNDDICIRCGLCYLACPRTSLPLKSLYMYQDQIDEIKEYSAVGPFIEAFVAQTKIPEIKIACQDGGISSTCLYYLFDQGKIDVALSAKTSDDPWRPDPFLIEQKETIVQAAGTKYVNNPNLQLLNQNKLLDKRIAVVGVPCQMQALLKSKIYNIGIPSLNNVVYRIGIFCMESFPYEGFLKICKILNVNVQDVKKTDINKGKFFVYTNSGEELSVPIKDISNLAREDCEVCYDLTSESADISIGSIGAPPGWNMVLIRTQKGKELYHELIAKGLIESKHVNDVKPGLPMLQKIAGIKRNTCKKHVNAKISENKRFPQY
ncbi:MAG: Coenzyme F420 hydrogenase/dehydrogenase, beta subunit C-terminal domain [Candidatus Lokiarchaeota archaeon]|nr:Coenzyme F420 hydrogenase/dehydrogenase, beta subunit C-terminal domain [Candidatus Lokiarchaeota archaeon]